MKTKLILIALMGVLMMSCAAFTLTSEKMSKIELGMTKDQTKKILGKGDPIYATTTPEGKIEKYGYINTLDSIRRTDYVLVFKNDRLIEWYLDEKRLDSRKGHYRK